GTTSVSSNVITFTPSSSLKKGYTYQVTVASGAQDLSGNPSVSSKTWTLRTACDPAQPNVVESAGVFRLEFAAGAFPEDFGVSVANPASAPREVSAAAVSRALGKGLAGGTQTSYAVPGGLVEINVYSKSTGERLRVPKGAVTLTLYYADSDGD